MLGVKSFLRQKFFSKDLDFRVRLFNVLAVAGIVVSLLSAIFAALSDEAIISVLMNFTTTLIAIALLVYASMSGRYRLCYMLTIILVFLVFFPIIFFLGGGYSGAMPFFFVFAVVFTVFMLEGKIAVIMGTVELLVYVGLCVFAYFYPETVTIVDTPEYLFTETIIGFVTISISLGATMLLHFRMYNRQNRELELAREEAVKFSEAKSAFLANTSHEIRTPINIILGMNEMIIRESQSPKIRQYAHSVQAAGKSLLALTENVLDVSRIEKGKLKIEEKWYKSERLIAELETIGKSSVTNRDVRFVLKIMRDFPTEFFGDFQHIKQVATNFLSNAGKYTSSGTVSLSFDWQREGAGETDIVLSISVSDTGCGIKQQDLARLFEPFERMDTNAPHHIEGTGLGLSIARQITELMGGRIDVLSTWGKGSVFTAVIPQRLHEGDGFMLAEQTEIASASSFLAPDCRVLIVDDNEQNLLVLKSLLKRTMLKLDTALSGRQCVEAAKSGNYDLILLDYMMPELDGLETLEELLKLENFKTPVIALTANVVEGVEQRLLASGFAHYISKPILAAELEAALVRFLPSERVMLADEDRFMLPPEQKEACSAQLLQYGISLEAALEHSGGDFLQFLSLAEIFTQGYEKSLEEIEGFAETRNWHGMAYAVHSLKSKAGLVGASNLMQTSERLEGLCAAENDEYILALLELLRFEWQLAKNGLMLCAENFAPNLSAAAPSNAAAHSVSEVMELLAYNRHYAAIDMLKEMENDPRYRESGELIARAIAAVGDMDYRGAELILKGALDGGENG